MKRAVVVLFAVSVLMVQAASAPAQHEGRADDTGGAGVRSELPRMNSPEAINWIGPSYPPPGGVTFTPAAGPAGAIGRAGGQLWYFSNLTLATKTVAYWGPMANLIRCSFNGPSYDAGELLQYIGISGGGNVAQWNGQTHFSTSASVVYVLFRLTLTQGIGAGGPALPLTYAPSVGIANSAGAVLQVTSGLQYTARLEMFASYDNASWVPALNFYDANNRGSSGAYTSVDAGFWYQPFQISTFVFGAGGSITPPGPTEVLWDASSPNYAIAGDPCWTLVDVVVDGTTHLGPVANYQFLNVQDNHTLAAYFNQNQQALVTSVEGSGTVERDPDQANYGCGSTVGLKAWPDPGWHFEGWSGDVSSTSWMIDVLMDGDKNITAKFAEGLPVIGGPEVTAFALTRVAPNPASRRVGIEYTAPREASIRLSVVDVQGRTVAVLADGVASAGRHEATWDFVAAGERPAAGLYFVRYEAAGASQVRRFLLVR